MNKEKLEQLNKLYIERCRQLSNQNRELNIKIASLNKSLKERNIVIEKLLENAGTAAKKADNRATEECLNEQQQKQFLPQKLEQQDAPSTQVADIIDNTKTSVNSFKHDFSSTPLTDIEEFAAQMISKMVIKSAECCNKITASESPDKKDLLNLVIGKNENSKYDITDILLSECSDDQKRQMITDCVDSAIEYFGCVLQQ